MNLHTLPIRGHFEDGEEIAENLRLGVPENDAERAEIAATILPAPESFESDHARRGYAFRYELGDHLYDGLYALRVSAIDASDREHVVEIAAGLALTGAAERSIDAGVPMWFISKRLHYRPVEGTPPEYAGVAFGGLRLDDAAALPQRRLFGA